MDGGLILTRNMLIMREGEVVGHLSKLQMRKCADGSTETEVVLHLCEPEAIGGHTFHEWRKVGDELRPEETPHPEHREGESEVEAVCYDTECVHCSEGEGEPAPCPHAVLRGSLTLPEDSDGRWDGWQLNDSEITCASYERREGADAEEAEVAGQQALPI